MTLVDPRLREVADLKRFETRTQVIMWLAGGIFFGLFALIGFIPGPLNDRIEYLCFQLTGHIDSRTVGWSTGIAMFVLTMVLVLGLAALPRRRRSSEAEDRYDRLKLLRTQLLTEGFTPGQLGYWTAANWRRLFWTTGIIFALIAMIAWGFVYNAHAWLPPSTRVTRNIDLETGKPTSEGLVRLSAVARLDFAFRVSTRNYGAAMLSGDDTHIYRLDTYGFQPIRGSRYHETLYVPLTAPDWQPGQPVGVFYQCEFSCAVNAASGAARPATHIVVTGVLHRTAMPLYVRRSFEAAGIAVASPYMVMPDEETDPLQPFATVALISFLLSVIFLGVPPFYRWSVKHHAPNAATAASLTAQPAVPFVATETIDVEGQQIAVRVIERSQEHHCSVLTGADGSVYLEYPVSVGPFKIDIPAIHVLSREELLVHAAGRLKLGEFSATLSAIAQATGKYERQDGAPAAPAAYARDLGALLQLIYMEAEVLEKIAQTDSNPRVRMAATGYASDVRKWGTELSADYRVSDPTALMNAAATWAPRLSSLARFIDLPCRDNPHNVEKEAIEKAIYDLSMQLYQTGMSGRR